jgi:hypothetical protein
MPLDSGIPLEIRNAPAAPSAVASGLLRIRHRNSSSNRKSSRRILRILWHITLTALVSPVIFAKESPAPKSLLTPRCLQD